MQASSFLNRILRVAAAAVLTAAAASCSSADLSVSGPSGTKCQVTVANSMQSAPATGASGVVNVTTTRDCAWDAASAAAWIEITEGGAGQGAGEVRYRVAPNADPVPRQGALRVNDTELSVRQEPAPCRFVVSPTSVSASSTGGGASIGVQTASACGWSVASEASWISVNGESQRSGNASITLVIEPNQGAARTGTVRVADQLVSVTQAASASAGPVPPPPPTPEPAPPAPPPPDSDPTPPPAPAPPPSPEPPPPPPPPEPEPCEYIVSPSQLAIPVLGIVGTATVTTGAACEWTATSNAPWLVVLSGSAGTGSGSVQYFVAANPIIAPRSASLAIAGQVFTITQDPAPCTYSISPTSIAVEQPETTIPVTVTAPEGCSWTAGGGPNWLGVSPASGSGNGTVTVSVERQRGNPPPRTGTVTIAGQPFTVTQGRDVTAP